MLGRLIQTAASYGKNNGALESATEEAHTRSLLYGQSQHVYSLAQSPPSSPIAGPTFRPGSFDDRGGLDLEEKDLRLIIAQDAYGAEEKPAVLFDSNNNGTSVAQTSPSHVRHASTAQAGTRAPLPLDWRHGVSAPAGKTQSDVSFRNRSSTISSAPSAWTRQLRDTSTREEALLECMFGVTSSTKATSTIKMHVIPAKQTPGSPGLIRGSAVGESAESTTRRMQLVRSRTSNISPKAQLPTLSSLETDSTSHDAVLITRLFHVSLPESVGTKDHNIAPSPTEAADVNANLEIITPTESGPIKKPKLIERKVPAFAIGLVVHLPRTSMGRPASTRPASRAAQGHTTAKMSTSFGSEMQTSWAVLNAIPEAFSAVRTPLTDTDRRIDTIVNNWEIILRAITALEHEASNVIFEQLDKNLRQASGPSQKVPKEKTMQRINQRIISITNPATISDRTSLIKACRHTIRRVCYALRVPRVVTGMGFAAGHWSDEARTLYRICGRRQQNFFLFTLLTAFLGNHTQWLQRLAPDWYRRQFRASRKVQSDMHVLVPRTIIISDQRTIARRLLFVLASFLPAATGLDGLQKVGEDFALAGRFSTSSPSSHVTRIESLRRTANRHLRDNRLQSTSNDKSLLSTSASSTDSMTPYLSRDKSHRYVARKDSDAVSIKGLHNLSHLEADAKKSSAGTTSAITPNPTTPVAYFSTKHDSYFPEGVLAETHESVASADLAKILRRSSSSGGTSSNVSSRWGSLVSGISDLLTNRQLQPNDTSAYAPSSPNEYAVDRRMQQAKGYKSTSNAKPLPLSTTELSSAGHDAQQSNDERRSVLQSVSPPQLQSPLKTVLAPKLKVDDKDGVIDVDLDWPGFPPFSAENPLFSPSRKTHRPSAASAGDGNESVRSLRSIPTLSPKAPVTEDISVAGFLRRHHQDFAVHAVRPYVDLDDDIKRSMMMEPSPLVDKATTPVLANQEDWTEVCTTLVADVRTFSIRRFVLRRKLNQQAPPIHDEPGTQPFEPSSKPTRRATFSKVEQEIVEEEVKDFDTTLADAIERVLNLTEAMQPYNLRSPNAGHARTLSSSTNRSVNVAASNSFNDDVLSISQEYAKQDCRQVIMGALEEIVKDVNNDLDQQQKGRAIQEAHKFGNNSLPKEVKQDNLLREGVKRWLHSVDELRMGH